MGYIMTDSSIRTAVAAWLSNPVAAEATYGHISTWDTGAVTDMAELFCDKSWCSISHSAGSSFNDDISAWDTSGVTDMHYMFAGASSFNQDLSGWRVDSVTSFDSTFNGASKFNGPIGDWRVDEVTRMHGMFYEASSFNQPIGDWCVDKVTSTRGMFTRASTFDQDISNWRVDKVTNMRYMFYSASKFNQDIGGWRVDNVLDMSQMFAHASSFYQNLDWCVGDIFDIKDNPYGYNINHAFVGTPCSSTRCGVVESTSCTPREGFDYVSCPTRRPTLRPTEQGISQISPGSGPVDTGSGSSNSGGSGGSGGADMGPIIGAVVGVLLLLAVGALWFYRRSKLSETKPSGVDCPPKPLEPLKAQPKEEATALSVAPEAEETLPARSAAAKGWFAAEPEGEPMAPEHGSASFAPEAEGPLPPGSWFSRFAPESEPEFEPEPEC